MDARDKFREILERHGLPIDLNVQQIAMNWKFFDGKNKVTFYGVGKPMPQNILEEIKAEVVPLILEEAPECEVIFSDRILNTGTPQIKQDSFDLFCQFYNGHYGA